MTEQDALQDLLKALAEKEHTHREKSKARQKEIQETQTKIMEIIRNGGSTGDRIRDLLIPLGIGFEESPEPEEIELRAIDASLDGNAGQLVMVVTTRMKPLFRTSHPLPYHRSELSREIAEKSYQVGVYSGDEIGFHRESYSFTISCTSNQHVIFDKTSRVRLQTGPLLIPIVGQQGYRFNWLAEDSHAPKVHSGDEATVDHIIDILRHGPAPLSEWKKLVQYGLIIQIVKTLKIKRADHPSLEEIWQHEKEGCLTFLDREEKRLNGRLQAWLANNEGQEKDTSDTDMRKMAAHILSHYVYAEALDLNVSDRPFYFLTGK